MNDIFLSYARPDRTVAQRLADALEALGWSVWWDREIPHGKSFDQVIEEELNAARCVVVVWTAESVGSRWVKTEAAAAADRDRLIPVLLDRVAIPFEFRRIQAAELYDWAGDRTHPEFVRLVESLKRMLGEPRLEGARTSAPPPAAAPSLAPTWKKTGAAVVLVLLIALAWWFRREPDAPAPPTKSAAKQEGTSGARDTPAKGGGPPAIASNPPPPEALSAPSTQSAPPAPSTAPQSASATGPFAIRIGDRIDDGMPQSGAGFIDTPGETDVYTFTANARQRVYFRMLKHSRGLELLDWKLIDPDGRTVFESRLGYSEPGVQLLRTAGSYRMTVGSERAAATGAYVMQLIEIPPPQQFSVKVGEVISENVPGPGAGVIERPGAKDVYVFNAGAGERVYFRKLDHARGMELIDWRVTDTDGTRVFESKLGYGDPGTHTLRKGGTYTLEVGSDNIPATGSYRIQLTGAPPG